MRFCTGIPSAVYSFSQLSSPHPSAQMVVGQNLLSGRTYTHTLDGHKTMPMSPLPSCRACLLIRKDSKLRFGVGQVEASELRSGMGIRESRMT